MAMRYSILFPLFFVALVSSIQGWSQSDEPCGSDGIHALELTQSEPYARSFEAVREAMERMRNESQRVMDVHTLPVVVHVIHRGSPIGEDENISDAQIISAIDGMNEDFRKMPGTLGDGAGADTHIQFEMARRTPNGAPTNGIVRVNGNMVPGFEEHGIANDNQYDGADQVAVKSLTTWFGDDYINIFVVPEINGNDGGSGTQGFAYLGPTGDARDGIVLLYNTFGLVGELKPGRDLNRTITHEMGHHLSLFHTFYNTNDCGTESNCENSGDAVCDTPSTTKNLSCNTPDCPNAILENYMDYTPQECKDMFTQGQSDRMRACLESSRSSLLESLGGLPVTDRDLTVVGLTNVGETTCAPQVAPVALVTNLGVDDVNGFQISMTLNDHSTITTIHATTIAPGTTVEATLPELSLDNSNSLRLEVALLGGDQDDFADNNVYDHSFDVMASDRWTLELETDQFASETSWSIETTDGEILAQDGDYENGSANLVYEMCIPEGCHLLKFEDTAGDGLCTIDFGGDGNCDVGGSMMLTSASGEVLAEFNADNNNFGASIELAVCAQVVALEGCEDSNDNGICDDAEVEGCQDVAACNFTPGAILDNGSCSYAEQHYDCDGECLLDSDNDGICNAFETEGCTDASACNYVPSATDNDGSCQLPAMHYDCNGVCLNDSDGDGVCDPLEVDGCTDNQACNYVPSATDNDGSCEFAATHYDCNEVCLNDSDSDGICDELEVEGCSDNQACNFVANATDEIDCTYPEVHLDCDGNCLTDSDGDGVCDPLEVQGCQEAGACNFDPLATDEGDCVYAEQHYDCNGACLEDSDNDGVCNALEVQGCDDQGANNYNVEATENDGSCTYDTFGCMDQDACNYNAFATEQAGECTYSVPYYDCNNNCLSDSDNDGICDELEIEGCTDVQACNYDVLATDEDGNCDYAEAFFDCAGNCLQDADDDGVCDEMEVDGCTDDVACNYSEIATEEDFSCEYPDPGYDCAGDAVSSIASLDEQPELKLFPNPLTSDHSMIHISGLSSESAFIRVLASDGRLAWEGDGVMTSPGVMSYPIRESVSPGTYFIQVGSSNPSGNIPLMIW